MKTSPTPPATPTPTTDPGALRPIWLLLFLLWGLFALLLFPFVWSLGGIARRWNRRPR